MAGWTWGCGTAVKEELHTWKANCKLYVDFLTELRVGITNLLVLCYSQVNCIQLRNNKEVSTDFLPSFLISAKIETRKAQQCPDMLVFSVTPKMSFLVNFNRDKYQSECLIDIQFFWRVNDTSFKSTPKHMVVIPML